MQSRLGKRSLGFGNAKLLNRPDPTIVQVFAKNRTRGRLLSSAIVIGFLLVMSCGDSAGYSVLTHEAIIDAVWNDSIEPLLRNRFPSATPRELLEAHAYAYGGAIIQDMGYYPFGSRFFSDLTHYVRT